jgi:hypothetical protein
MKFFRTAIILVAGFAISGPAFAANLIANGDFSSGFTDFTSTYTQVTNGAPGSLVPEGTYTIGNNPIVDHPSFVDFSSPSNPTPSNPMLFVNGSTNGGDSFYLYSNPLGTTGLQTYSFSATVIDICCNPTFTSPNNPSTILFQISTDNFTTNIQEIAFVTSPPADAGVVHDVTGSFTTTGPFSFRIADAANLASGNDFAIDDLNISPVPEASTWAMMILGFLGVGFMAYRRKNTPALRLV